MPVKRPPPAAAAAAPAPAKKAAAKKPSTALVPWEAQMAAKAAIKAKAEVVRGLTKKISTQGGILKIDEDIVEDNELRVIVVGFVPENQYYSGAYDPRNPTVPDCYAFGDPDADEPENGMGPVREGEAAVENPQGDDNGLCAECWANAMGTADVGRGKACKNIRRLAVVTEDALESPEDLLAAEMRMLNVPVMSVRNWSKYVNMLNDDMSRPPEGVVTTVSLVPDPKTQFQVCFKFEELVNFTQELWDAMQKKLAEAQKELLAPYPKQADLDAANAAKPVQPRGKMAQRMAGGKASPANRPAGKATAKVPTKKTAGAKY